MPSWQTDKGKQRWEINKSLFESEQTKGKRNAHNYNLNLQIAMFDQSGTVFEMQQNGLIFDRILDFGW